MMHTPTPHPFWKVLFVSFVFITVSLFMTMDLLFSSKSVPASFLPEDETYSYIASPVSFYMTGFTMCVSPPLPHNNLFSPPLLPLMLLPKRRKGKTPITPLLHLLLHLLLLLPIHILLLLAFDQTRTRWLVHFQAWGTSLAVKAIAWNHSKTLNPSTNTSQPLPYSLAYSISF